MRHYRTLLLVALATFGGCEAAGLKVRSFSRRSELTAQAVEADERARWWPSWLWGSGSHVVDTAPEAPSTPAPQPHEPCVKDTQKTVMASERFVATIEMVCKEAPPNEQKMCHAVQEERLWCAMFARNIQKMIQFPDFREEKGKCRSVLAEKEIQWFLGATWDIGHAG